MRLRPAGEDRAVEDLACGADDDGAPGHRDGARGGARSSTRCGARFNAGFSARGVVREGRFYVEESGGMLDAHPVPVSRQTCDRLADAALDPKPGGDARGAQDPDRGVAAHRDEGAGHDRATVQRRCQQAEFGHGGAFDVTEPHQLSGLQPDLPEPFGEGLVRLQGGGGLVSGDTERGRGDQHGRHAVVHAGDRYVGHEVTHPAGRQQRAATLRELDDHRRRGPRHPGDLGGAGVVDAPFRGGEGRDGEVPGVEHADPHRRTAFSGGDQSALDGERADPGEEVPTVLTITHFRCVDAYLEEQVVDVRLGSGRGGYHRNFAGQGARRPGRRSGAGRDFP